MDLRLAVLGDSVAYGTGARRIADTLAPRLAARLELAGWASETRVLAVPGARSAALAAQVARAVRWQPHVAVVVIGANDLTHLVPAEDAAAALREAVGALRAAGAQVVVAPAPDLSVLPHVPPAARELVRAGSLRLRALQTAAVREQGGRVADPDGDTSRAFATDASLFSADRFHPSSAGYAVIAAALTPHVLAAADAAAGAQAG